MTSCGMFIVRRFGVLPRTVTGVLAMGAWRALSARLKALLLLGVGSQAVHAQADPASQAWEAARSANTIEAYEQFLEAHPDSPAADAAFDALIDRTLSATGREPVRGIAVDIY